VVKGGVVGSVFPAASLCRQVGVADCTCLGIEQTSIQTEGFRSLAEGEPVEFYVEAGDDGKTKAVQVTGPGGAPPQVRILTFSWPWLPGKPLQVVVPMFLQQKATWAVAIVLLCLRFRKLPI
jgi:'Cold-shock' DNA-binding domain